MRFSREYSDYEDYVSRNIEDAIVLVKNTHKNARGGRTAIENAIERALIIEPLGYEAIDVLCDMISMRGKPEWLDIFIDALFRNGFSLRDAFDVIIPVKKKIYHAVYDKNREYFRRVWDEQTTRVS